MFGVMEKDKYIVILAKKINGKYSKIGQKKADPTKPTVAFKNNSYPVNYEQIIYRDGLKNYILIDIDNSQQLKEGDMFSQVPTTLIDSILAKSIVHQLTSRLNPSNWTGSIILIIMTMLAGIFIGYFIGNAFPMSQVQNMTGAVPAG